jgi:hypothetical protein
MRRSSVLSLALKVGFPAECGIMLSVIVPSAAAPNFDIFVKILSKNNFTFRGNYSSSEVGWDKRIIIIQSGLIVVKLFTAVIYKCFQ